MAMIIAIDGPAGSGKSTTARGVAERLRYHYLDTGAMYRAATLAFQRAGMDLSTPEASDLLDEMRIDLQYEGGMLHVWLDEEEVTEEIRQPHVTAAVSRIAADPRVRMRLVDEQRRIAQAYLQQGKGVVLDGRDIGTHVFPDAAVKVFLVADPSVRAERRLRDLQRIDVPTSHEDVLAELQKRDEIDSGRSVAPLRKADDAIELDTSRLTIEQQVDQVVALVRERRN